MSVSVWKKIANEIWEYKSFVFTFENEKKERRFCPAFFLISGKQFDFVLVLWVEAE